MKMNVFLKRRITLLCLFMCAILNVSAQNGWSSINVAVTPSHKDWNYRVGETAEFKVAVLRSGTTVDNAEVDFEAGPEM